MSDENIPQMREQISALEADLTKVRDSEKAAHAQVRELTGQVLALGQGFTAAQGGLYAKVSDGELSPEGFVDFATEQGLPQVEAKSGQSDEGEGSSKEGDLGAKPPVGSPDLSQMARGGSRPGDSAGGAAPEKMTRQEWQEMYANDPERAKQAVASGLVEISGSNPFGASRAVAAGTNPYASKT